MEKRLTSVLNINQTFTAHPIGQGFFYSGSIQSGNAKYNFIFDCGSYSKERNKVISKCVKEYNEKINDSDIDLLILSHFHADHTNGLRELLKGERKVKKVIAPYLSFEEKVTIALDFYLNEYEKSDDNGPDEDIDFILRTILDISTQFEDSTQFFFVDPPSNGNPSDQGYENLEQLNTFDEFDLFFEESNDIEKNKFRFNCNKKVSILIGNSKIAILDLIFYRRKITNNDNELFKKVYNEFITKNNDQFKDYQSPTVDEIIKVIKTLGSKWNNVLKEEYNNIKKSSFYTRDIVNSTALTMLHWDRIYKSVKHYSINSKRNLINIYGRLTHSTDYEEHGYCYSFEEVFRKLIDYKGYISNTFLTSDTYLNNEGVVSEFLNYYKDYLKINEKNDIGVFQIPHHGSKENLDKHFFDQVISKIEYSFINFGESNIYNHPHEEIISYYNDPSKRYIDVDEENYYQTHYSISFLLL